MQRREGMDKHNQEGGRDTHLVFGLETFNDWLIDYFSNSSNNCNKNINNNSKNINDKFNNRIIVISNNGNGITIRDLIVT